MNEMIVINKTEILGNEIQVFGDFENPLFLAKDVSNWIEHTDLSRMVGLVDEDEKLKRTMYASGQNREMWFLTEDGLYEVLMQSRKPIAKQFKKQIKAMLKGLRKGELQLQPTKEEEKAQLLLSIYNGGQEGVVASKQLTELEVKEATTPLIATIEEQKPDVNFAIKVQEDNQTTYSMSDTAKALKLGFGRNKLLANLRRENILMRGNEPYQRYVDQKYFIVKISDVGVKRVVTTRVTGKGLKYLDKIRDKIS